MVVPVLLRDRARTRWATILPARVREADLADALAEMAVRRRHLRCGAPRRSTTRTTSPSSFTTTAGALGLAGGEPEYDALEGSQPGRSLPSRRSPLKATRTGRRTRPVGVCGEVHRQVRTSESDRRDRAQLAARGAARVRSGDRRRERDVAGQDTKRYPDSGGWGFGRFIHGKPVDAAQRETCVACHQGRVKATRNRVHALGALAASRAVPSHVCIGGDGGMDPPPTCANQLPKRIFKTASMLCD